MSSRTSIICISKGINIDKNYKHTLALTSNNIKSLCSSGNHQLYYGNDYSFLRPEGRIKVQVSYSQLFEANYCYITNQGKTQFFFIDEIIYIADNTTELKVTEDIVTTYKDYGFNKVYCERQHSQEDEPYANTVDEGIRPSNYVKNGTSAEIDVNPVMYKALFSEIKQGENNYVQPMPYEVGKNPQNQINTMHYITGPIPGSSYTGGMSLQDFVTYYHGYIKDGKGADLLCMYTMPQPGFNKTATLSNEDRLDGYLPVNKKMYCYPFCLVHMSNNTGSSVDYKPELLKSNQWRCVVADNGKAQAFCYPTNYANKANNYEYGLLIDNYPTIPMAIDSYSAWIGQSQNGFVNGMIGKAVTTGLSIALSPLTGGASLVGAISAGTSMFSDAFNYGMETKVDNTPDTVTSMASGNIISQALQSFKFTIEKQCITREQAEVIDNFFTRFGYAQNRLMQVRHINPRFHCHYVKTAPGENVMKAVPHAKASIINNAFAAGITFWDDNDEVGNYNPK